VSLNSEKREQAKKGDRVGRKKMGKTGQKKNLGLPGGKRGPVIKLTKKRKKRWADRVISGGGH